MIVVTSRRDSKIDDIPIKNFRPIGEFELPEYELQKLSFPPILQILDYIQREQFTEIIISTPGPIGLSGLLAAKMLNLQTSGIYHTDFPQYIRILTEDRFLESLAWNYMHWFYGQVDTVFVNSEQYRKSWVDRGFDPEKLKILPRGLDTDLVHARRGATRDFGNAHGSKNGASAFALRRPNLARKRSRRARGGISPTARGRFAGELIDGRPRPLLESAGGDVCPKRSLPVTSRRGARESLRFCRHFRFSEHDRHFRQRHHRSAGLRLPVIVSDLGGPKELVSHGLDGLITKAHDVEEFASAMRTLVNDPKLRAEMAKNARQRVVDRSWPSAFRKFWAATEL